MCQCGGMIEIVNTCSCICWKKNSTWRVKWSGWSVQLFPWYSCMMRYNDTNLNTTSMKRIVIFCVAQIPFHISAPVSYGVLYVSFLGEMGRVNTLRPRQNGRHFQDDIFKFIFLNEKVWITIEVPLKFVPKGPINNIPTLVQVMAWRRPGDKPLSEPMMVSSLTHICVTRSQRVKAVPNRNLQHDCVQ